jgi:hypothetical protein
MMYDLIEQAKQEIEVNDLTQGSIGILVPDTLLQIFKLLNYRNLSTRCRQRIASENFCQNQHTIRIQY